MTRTSIVIAAVAAALLTGSLAHAESDTVSTKVSFSGLDLSTVEGAKAAYSRIAAASAGACDAFRDDAGLDGMAQFRTCRSQFTAKAVAQTGSPVLMQVATGSRPIRLASH